MVREAEEHAAEDKPAREEAETRNNAEQLAYSTEKLLKDNDDKLPADVKEEVQAAVDALKQALAGTDVDAVKAKHEELAKASQELGAALYAQAAEGEAAGAGAGAGSSPTDGGEGDEDVVDAEIVDEGK